MIDHAEDKKAQSKNTKPKSSWRRVSVFLIALFLLTDVVLGGAIYWFLTFYTTPGPLTEEKIIEIEAGSGVNKIASVLEREGIIEKPWAFRVMVQISGVDTQLKAGEYLIPSGVTPEEAALILVSGNVVKHHITFPEGRTSKELITLLNQVDGLGELITEIPKEGSLLPETYQYIKGMTRQQILERMQQSMQETLDHLWLNRADGLPFKTKEEALILASIVEKETSLEAERGLIAGVFINRLEKGMRLQTDPTVIYGITEGQFELDRPLSRKDLKEETPYNTYTNYGLPPGPISNPGRASLVAVMKPESTEALFFVADGTGGHAFSRTLDEHNSNVAKWRKIEKAN